MKNNKTEQKSTTLINTSAAKAVSKKEKAKRRKLRSFLASWLVKIFILTFSLSLAISSISEIVLSASGIAVAVVVIIFFLCVSVITDVIATAVMSCDAGSFKVMASQQIKGAREALALVRHKDKVASFMGDIAGDICSILSGSAGAAIVAKIINNANRLVILVAGLIAAVIASTTITGKALGKAYAKKNDEKIILGVGKLLTVFTGKNKEK